MGIKLVSQPGHGQPIQHGGNGVPSLPKDDPWQALKQGLDVFELGFVLTRELPQEPVGDDRGNIPSAAPAPFKASASPSAK